MTYETGSIVDGTVVKVAEYGAIVRLPGGKTGLVHISEISDAFVRDVNDYLKEQDQVRVKILSINDKGRYEFSIKNIEQPEREAPKDKPQPEPKQPETVNLGPDDSSAPALAFGSFEERMSQFLRDSQDRLSDIKRHTESKLGFKKRL
jgi:S1 RNA binding domain protein